MARTAWYRSLYWRVGVGLVSFLVGVLVVQGLAVVWLISRMEVAPGPPSPDVTRLVSRELSEALAIDPKLDVEQFLRQQYEQRLPVAVVMRDGRVLSSDGRGLAGEVVAELRGRMDTESEFLLRMDQSGGWEDRRGRAPRPAGPPGGFDRGPGLGPGSPPGGRFGGPLRRGGPPGPIVLNGRLVGLAVANPRSTFEQLGPMLLAVGLLLVGIGTTSAALLIFGPVRRRLRSLENAARSVGAGDLTARAQEDGGDEVAALARTFNQMTADLGARAEQLQAADRTRRMLFADVSHELMTPLTAMRGYLETLSMRALTLDQETRERYLSIVGDETERLEHIVRDLLDLARMESGGDTLDLQDVPLEDLFGRVVSRHERDARLRGVRMTTHIAAGAEIVSGDPMRLEQALQNLASNALRHTPRDGRVELSAEVSRHQIVIAVRDTGSGIALEHLAHVFDRFYKVDPSRGAGSGLGLSIVKAIIERHKGTIAVSSEPGEGTLFTIRLPMAS